jgi:hypothetical protein
MLHSWITIGRMPVSRWTRLRVRFDAIVKRGLTPTLGSQEIVDRRPLKVWSSFEVELSLAGYDDTWVYHVHRFLQGGEVRAIGITRALNWKRDVPTAMTELLDAQVAPVAPDVGGREPH